MRNYDRRVTADNSYGAGEYVFPASLSHLGNYAANLAPTKLVDVKAFPKEGVWMLVAKADAQLSVTVQDLQALIKLGLVRMQVNSLGTMSFYFQGHSMDTYDRRVTAAASPFWKPVMDEDPKKVAITWVRPGNRRDGEAHAFEEATFEDKSQVVNNVSLCGKKYSGTEISKARASGSVSSEKCSKCEAKAKTYHSKTAFWRS